MTLVLCQLMTPESRQQIWLAEVAGLLHDWQKAIDMAVASHWRNNSSLTAKAQQWQQRGETIKPKQLSDILSQVRWTDPLRACGDIDLKTLCEEGRDPSSARKHRDWRVQLLGEVHAVAHVDKELQEREFTSAACDWISSPFGYEFLQPHELFTPLLTSIQGFDLNSSASRDRVLKSLRGSLERAWADTRRPINEVTLWDWGSASAALYKAVVAQAILEGWNGPEVQHWRFLRVGVDRLSFAERASRIPDLLGRMRVIDEALDEVREFLEEICPLGNEVYRDETGSIFVVPDLQGDLLNGAVDHSLSLQSRLEGIFSDKTAGELLPRVFLGPPARENLSLGALLREPVGPARRDVGRLSAFWSADGGQEKCVVCSFRPQGGGAGSSRERALAKARHVCVVCLERSGGRVGAWLKDAASDEPRTTVWVDEASDDNGRCALLVGHFVLDRWLDGTMIRTLALGKDNAGSRLPKNPSFARIRRVWESTRRFWADVRDDLSRTAGCSVRWKLAIQTQQPPGLERHHVYEIDVGNQPFPVVWDGSGLATADNLTYAASVRGIGVQDSGWQTRLRRMLSGQHIVYEPGSYGGRRRAVATVTVADIVDHSKFVPLIPIAEEPSLFMCILPAKAALQAVGQIERRYTQEIGKVRSRLGLHVGLVFFPRKIPIPAVIDAGRRFLAMPDREEWWTIRSIMGGRLEFENGIAWEIPAQLGDGSDDQYYSFFLAPASASATPQPVPWIERFDFGAGESDYQVLHLSELQAGMRVLVWPSRFDFQFLGNAADRFHIAYGGGAKRPGQRPYYLEHLEGHLCALWKLVAGSGGLTTTQIMRIFGSIEARRLAWGRSDGPDEVLVRLASDLWSTAEWLRQPAKRDIERLARASADGSLADVIELFMGILKQRPARDEALVFGQIALAQA